VKEVSRTLTFFEERTSNRRCYTYVLGIMQMLPLMERAIGYRGLKNSSENVTLIVQTLQ
jgi:hypothetical protein